MNNLFSPFSIKSHTIKNRIVLPPIVNFGWGDENGFVSDKHVNHYESIAKGGAGLIIVEATCVLKEGRIFNYQLGIWSDKHIEGLKRITDACHKHGAIVLLQLHHAGLATRKRISNRAVGPSAHDDIEGSHTLTIDEIHEIEDAFTKAAIRAQKVGFDGVELHGAHGYLINQFTNSIINSRTDQYGGSIEKCTRFSTEIIQSIKKSVDNNFIVGYRMGANSPTIDDGIKIAKIIEKQNVDYLHVSHGGEKGIIPEIPSNFEYNWIVFSGLTIKKQVNIPVITVNEIKTPERASWLLDNGYADFVAIGRDMLTDYEWANKAQSNDVIDYCISCKPQCKRFAKAESCPVVIGRNKKLGINQ